MNARHLETALARLYADPQASADFLRDPQAWCREAGLGAEETVALVTIDRTGLAMAARSYAAKRRARGRGWTGARAMLVHAIRAGLRNDRREPD